MKPVKGKVKKRGALRRNRRIEIEAEIRPRASGRPTCSGCRLPGPGFFSYAMRKVDCLSCGVRVELVPWAEGKNHLTKSYAWFLAGWARRMGWRSHRELILSWFRARGQLSARAVEGLDGKVRVVTKRACGFRTCRAVVAYPSRTSPTDSAEEPDSG